MVSGALFVAFHIYYGGWYNICSIRSLLWCLVCAWFCSIQSSCYICMNIVFTVVLVEYNINCDVGYNTIFTVIFNRIQSLLWCLIHLPFYHSRVLHIHGACPMFILKKNTAVPRPFWFLLRIISLMSNVPR